MSKNPQALKEKELGNEAYRTRNFETALSHYKRAIELDPTDMTFLTNVAAIYFEQKKYDECIEECAKAIDIGRENRADFKIIARAYSRIANAYLKQKNYAKAKEFYQKSLAEHRTPETREKLSQVEKVLKEEERTSYINPEISLDEKSKGNACFKNGDYPTAIKHYTEAIRRNPDDAILYSNRAACYTKLAEFQLGLKDCDECIRLDPNFIKGYIRKGAVLLGLKEPSRAMQAYQKALDLDDKCQEAIDGFRRCSMATSSDPEEVRKRAMADPEVQGILKDPAMRMILEQMQEDPRALEEHLKNPVIAGKITKLIESVNGKVANKQICADLDCKEPISLAKTLIKYASQDRKIMSFGLNEEVTVYKKYEGENADLWTVQIGGKRGEAPKRFIREYKMIAKSTVTLPVEKLEDVVIVKETATVTLSTPSSPDSLAVHPESAATAAPTEIGGEPVNVVAPPVISEKKQSTSVEEQAKISVEEQVKIDESLQSTRSSEELVQSTLSSEELVQSTLSSEELVPSTVADKAVEISVKDQITSVELQPSVTLDNIIEYTNKKDSGFVVSAESGVWFPDVTSSFDSLDDTQKLSLSSENELLPSLTAADSLSDATSAKYVVVDGTSFYDEPLESISTESILTDSAIQPTPVVTTPSLDEKQFSSINYYESSGTTEATSVTADLSSTSDTISERILEESDEGTLESSYGDHTVESNSDVETTTEVVASGWLSGISNFFNLEEDASKENLEMHNGAKVTTPEEVESFSDPKTVAEELGKMVNAEPLSEKNEDFITAPDQDSHPSKEKLIETVDETRKNVGRDDKLNEDPEEDVNNEKSNVPAVEMNDDKSEDTSENDVTVQKLLPDHDVIGESEVPIIETEKSQVFQEKDDNTDDEEPAGSSDVSEEQNSNLEYKSEDKLMNDTSEVTVTDSELSERLPTVEDGDNSYNIVADLEKPLSEETSDRLPRTTIQSEETFNEVSDNATVVDYNGSSSPSNIDDSTEKPAAETAEDDELEVKEYVTDDYSSSLTEDDLRHSQYTSKVESVENESSLYNSLIDTERDVENITEMVPEAIRVSESESDTNFCYSNADGSCEELSKNKIDVLKEGEKIDEVSDEETTSSNFLSQISSIIHPLTFWIPETLVETSPTLEVRSISPNVVILTIIVGFFVFILEISFMAIKKSLKEKQYLAKLSNLDQKLFSTVVERDNLMQELTTLKLTTENNSSEYVDAQQIIDSLEQELKCTKNNSIKLQEAVTKLQEQLDSQQSTISDLQLKLEAAEIDSAQNKNEKEELNTKLAMAEQSISESSTRENELITIKKQLDEDILVKDQQILELQQTSNQLLKEGEEWNESVRRLQVTSANYQSKIQELNDTLTIKDNELAAVKEFLTNLKYSSKELKCNEVNSNENNEPYVVNADKILEQISNVSDIKAKLAEITEERNLLKNQLQDETKARSTVEETVHICEAENEKLKEEYNKAHHERLEAQTKLDVLSNYFKEKEMQLQKELGVQEAMRQQSQENVTSVTHRIATYEQQAELNSIQITTLKAELENQERSFKTQLLAQEKKAHENWIAARVAERKVEQFKQEASVLRNKLTLLEQDKAEQSEANKSVSQQVNSSINGDFTSSQNALEPDDRSASMDLPTSGRSSLFRESLDAESRFRLPPDRPLPPPPFMPPLPILPPPHMLPMGNHVPLLAHPPPPHMIGPRRLPFSPVDPWMSDRIRHSSPYGHPSNRDSKTPPSLSHQRSPPPFDDRSGPLRRGPSHSPINSDRRVEDAYTRDFYREQTPPSRFAEHHLPPGSFMPENVPSHLRRHRLDGGSLDQRKSSVASRNDNGLSSV
ncbi:Stress-induced-phosphoprotein 1 [Chamberlinius hualienensis]